MLQPSVIQKRMNNLSSNTSFRDTNPSWVLNKYLAGFYLLLKMVESACGHLHITRFPGRCVFCRDKIKTGLFCDECTSTSAMPLCERLETCFMDLPEDKSISALMIWCNEKVANIEDVFTVAGFLKEYRLLFRELFTELEISILTAYLDVIALFKVGYHQDEDDLFAPLPNAEYKTDTNGNDYPLEKKFVHPKPVRGINGNRYPRTTKPLVLPSNERYIGDDDSDTSLAESFGSLSLNTL